MAGISIGPLMAPDGFPIRVLLVDDQAIVGETVRRMLAGEPDIEFRFCPDPADAIDAANEFQPTVILQDLVMPDIDGLQLVKFFRANPATRDTPLIVLSSKEEPVIKAKAFALGANDYLVKLPDKLEVVARVRYHSRGYITLLERNEAYRQLAEKQRRTGRGSRPGRPLRAVAAAAAADGGAGRGRLAVRALDAARRRHVRLPLARPRTTSPSTCSTSAGTASARRCWRCRPRTCSRPQSLPDTDFRDPGQVIDPAQRRCSRWTGRTASTSRSGTASTGPAAASSRTATPATRPRLLHAGGVCSNSKRTAPRSGWSRTCPTTPARSPSARRVAAARLQRRRLRDREAGRPDVAVRGFRRTDHARTGRRRRL